MKISWTEENIEWLKENYPTNGKLFCANYFGVKESSIRSKAYKLKLKLDHSSDFAKKAHSKGSIKNIGKKRPGHGEIIKSYYQSGRMSKDRIKSKEFREMITAKQKEYVAKHGHPRGFLGKKHSEKAKQDMSEGSKSSWKLHTKKKIMETKLKARNTMIRNKTILKAENMHTRGIGGKRKDLDDQYFRSRAEANFARYLKHIGIKYEYEKKHFFFEGLRRGCVSYTPDFYIEKEDRFIEFKGWLDPKSITKLKRFKKYFPIEFSKLTIVKQGLSKKNIDDLISIGFKREAIESYSIAESLCKVIPFWE